MKNLNLIKRLWTDSHEKQSLQRFFRYAAILIMLLTLGVGQMWADFYLMKKSSNNNDKGTSLGTMTSAGSDVWYYEWTCEEATNQNAYFYVTTNTSSSACSSVDYLAGITLSDSWSNVYLYGSSCDNRGSDCPKINLDQTGKYRFEFNSNEKKFRCIKETFYYLMHNTTTGSKGSSEGLMTTEDNETYTKEWTTTLTSGDQYFYVSTNTSSGANNNCDYLNGSNTLTANTWHTLYKYGTSNYDHIQKVTLSGAGTYTFYFNVNNSDYSIKYIYTAQSLSFPTTSGSVTEGDTKNITVNTVGIANGTTVTFKVSGSSIGTASVSSNSATLSYTPDAAGTEVISASVTINGTTLTSTNSYTLTVNSAETEYTVSFDMQGHGSAISDQDVESGGTIEEPSDPSATGYTFGGWYKEAGCTNEWDFDDNKVTEATTLYAKWTAKTYTAADNLDKNGGDSHGQYTATYYNTSIVVNTPPSRSGYTVEGYYKQAACTNKIASSAGALVASTSYTDGSSHWTNDGNETLYTNWTPNPYTITFNGNKGSRSGTVTNIQAMVTVTYDNNNFNISSTPVSSVDIPVLTGYTFGGYYTEIDGAGTQIVAANGAWIVPGSGNGNDYLNDNGKWVKAANTNVYAKWTAKQTTVTLDLQSGSDGDEEVTATFDAAMPDATMPTRLGYDFGGYYTSTGGSGTQYYTSGGASARNWNIEDATKTLYAKWTAHDYTITYNLNGGTGATNTTYTILSSLITLPTAPTVNKTGYTFGGWYANSGLTGDPVTSIAAGSTGDKEYWAKWTEIKVSISPTVNSVGTAQGYTASATVGSIGIATTTVLTAEEPGEGYSFNTWDLSSNLVITSGSLTNRSITVRTNGDGNSVTAEAQYVENNFVRLYLKNVNNWGTPKAYIWNSDNTSDKNGTWAGVAMTYLCANYYVYEYNRTLNSGWDKVIFSDNGGSQTSNLDIAGHEGMCYNNSTGKWEEFTYANTFYFVNSEGWDEVWIYHYGGTNKETNFGAWNGTEMEKVGTVTIDGHAFDYYGAPDGICDDLDGNYIINNGQSGSAKKQTRDIAGNASLLGKYYLADGCFVAADSQTDDTKPTGTLYSASEILSARIGCTDAVDFALIHDINLSPSRVPPLATIMATPDMTKKRAVDQAYCWGVYTDAACTRQVSNVSFISLGDGTVQFAAPETQGTYYLKLTVRASDACDASIDAEKVVSFTVTTEDMVFFKNVPGWGNVHFYYLGKAYWNGSVDGDDGLGSGCNTSVDGGAARGMTRIGNSDIYYYDYSGNSTIKTHLASNPITYIAFTDNYKPTSDHFSGCQAIYRGDFSACAPMLVPENYITCHKNTDAGDGSAAYYQRGYWTNYMSESSGFTLYVWDVTSGSGNEITRHTMTGTAGNNTYTYTYNFKNDPQKHDLPYTYGFKFLGCGGSYYGASSTMDITNCTDWNLGTGTNNCGLSVTAQMEHTFILTLAGDGHVQVSVEYPVRVGDYRLLYDDETQDPQASQFIRQRANGKDTVAMYIRPTATEELKVQRCSGIDGETITWTDYDWKTDVDTIYVAGKPNGVYNFYLEQDASGNLTVNTSETKPYTGQYYIRTSVVDGGWNSYKSSADNLMTYAQYPDDRGYGFNYYKAKWVEATESDVTYTIACDYSPALCKTLEGDPGSNPLSAAEARSLPHSANIRFGWHSKTNQLKREYINGSTNISDRFLVMIGDSKLMNPDGTPLAISGLNANEISFTDLNNWIYRCDVKAQEGAAVRLVANYDGHTQDFIGSEGEPEEIIGGTGSEKYVMRVTYDFKTNRLMTAWLPSGNIDKDMTLKADMLLIRKGQNAATQVHFTGAYSISEIHTIYGVLEFQYDSIAGKFSSWSSTNAYKYLMYYLSFPFEVKVSEIFGCGIRGTNWIIQKYNGAKRAQIGWFAETSTFWETLPGDSVLHPNEGYLLILDRISFNDASSSLWYKQGSGNSIYLYFPSTSATSGTISESTATIKVPEHTCTINRSFYVDEKIGTVNHKNTDSHWNVIGTPLFENKTATTIATPAPDGDGATTLQYYYAWDYDDNSLIARSALTTSTVFKSMHGYMVQYAGDVTFEGAKLTPPSASVAARHIPSDKKNYLIELKMVNENGKSSDAYVELRENACDTFALNEDMYMMRSSSKADLYTFAGNYDVAANVLSMNNHIVPVGMDVKCAGTYRFTMPSEFSGTVTLIDTETGVRTNLALGDYEVALPKGTSNTRFLLEIDIQQMPTAIDGVGGSLKDGKAHKFIENGQMYILQNGIIYDAQGKRVK